MLAASPQMLVLNLPDRSAALLSRDSWRPRGPGKFLWTGRGDGCSGIFNVIPGHAVGTIACLSGNYRMRSGTAGTHLTRIVASAPPPRAVDDVARAGEPQPLATPTITIPPPPPSPIVEDRIDVLVLYTALVRQDIQAQGGNVQLEMQHLIDETQQAMVNSASARTGFPLTDVFMVHTQEVARGESGTLNSDLLYLRESTEPQSLRSVWKADIIMLVRKTKSQNKCGLAYTPGFGGAPGPADFAPLAVGVAVRVTKEVCTYAPYNFQHEFGHILGGNHNEENNDNTTPLEPWALAHWSNPMASPKSGHRTILSYVVPEGGPGEPYCHGECIQVLHYANADITYLDPIDNTSFVTGVMNLKENARVIAEVAPYAWLWSDRIFANGFEFQ